MSGQVDAIGCSTTVAAQIAKRAPADTYEEKFVLRQQVMAVALRRGQTELLKTVNEFIATNKANGELEQALPEVARRPALPDACRNSDDQRADAAAHPQAIRGWRPSRIIRIENVNKWYGHFQVLTDIDLEVAAGERIVVCGPSGSGKSTLIRCINRLEKVQKGRIVVDGIDLTAGGKATDAVRARSAWCSSSSTCSRT